MFLFSVLFKTNSEEWKNGWAHIILDSGEIPYWLNVDAAERFALNKLHKKSYYEIGPIADILGVPLSSYGFYRELVKDFLDSGDYLLLDEIGRNIDLEGKIISPDIYTCQKSKEESNFKRVPPSSDNIIKGKFLLNAPHRFMKGVKNKK